MGKAKEKKEDLHDGPIAEGSEEGKSPVAAVQEDSDEGEAEQGTLNIQQIAERIQAKEGEVIKISGETFRELVAADLVNNDGITKFLKTGKQLEIV